MLIRMQKSKSFVKKVLHRNDSFDSWTRNHVCYTRAKSYLAFCPSRKTFCEITFKNDGIIHLEEEISKQPNFHAFPWVLLTTYN